MVALSRYLAYISPQGTPLPSDTQQMTEITLLVHKSKSSATPGLARKFLMTVGDRRFYLSDPIDTRGQPENIPPYICVSYAWEECSVETAVGSTISDRTMPCLEAAIRCKQTINAFWVDVFCMPNTAVKHWDSRLQDMAYVYSHAEGIVIVMDESTWEAVEEIVRLDNSLGPRRSNIESVQRDPSARLLETLNNDVWIRSKWGYQEVVTSQALTFTGQRTRSLTSLEGLDFLNHLGSFLDIFRRVDSKTAFDIRQEYPFVDALEDALVDWSLKPPIGPGLSAFAGLCGVYRRLSNQDDYPLAPISCISILKDTNQAYPLLSATAPISTLMDSLFSVCEEKGDFSFIFCSNERDVRLGLKWRPTPERLLPIAIWTNYGEGQRGERVDGRVILRDMYRLITPATEINDTIKGGLYTTLSLQDNQGNLNTEQLQNKILERLRAMNYTGSSSCSVWKEGFFFPQTYLPSNSGVDIWVSTAIRWPFGAPGIAIITRRTESLDSEEEIVPGVFVGSHIDALPDSGVRIA